MLKQRSGRVRTKLVVAALGLAALMPMAAAPVADAQAGQSCTWSATAEVLYYAMPDIVGECQGPEQPNPQSGILEQRTTRGTMMRQSNGLTAFSDGTSIWILGEDGNVSRQEGNRLP